PGGRPGGGSPGSGGDSADAERYLSTSPGVGRRAGRQGASSPPRRGRRQGSHRPDRLPGHRRGPAHMRRSALLRGGVACLAVPGRDPLWPPWAAGTRKATMTRRPTIAIVGGGITALSAASVLASGAGEGVRVVLIEGERRLGGKIRTEELEGRQIEAGPDALLARVPWAVSLCEELGLADDLIPSGRPRRPP